MSELFDKLFTPTQRRILEVLSDGMPHTRAELHACLKDELCLPNRVHKFLGQLRRILRPLGHDILCEWDNHRPRYRHVILLPAATKQWQTVLSVSFQKPPLTE